MYNRENRGEGMNQLDKARININAIDEQMAKLFEQRMEAVEEVVAYKIQTGKEVLDRSREQMIKDKNVQYIQNEKYKESYMDFFTHTLQVSRDYQKRLISKNKVAYGGIEGAFSYIATKQLFPHNPLYAYPTFDEVVKNVETGVVEYGVIPFENSSTGEVNETALILKEAKVYITGTYDLKITQNLLGVKGTTLSDIKKVYSHPQGISQCQLFLKGRDIEVIPYSNTALAAKLVSELQDPSIAAIASKETAQLYDLDIVVEEINTNKDNTTRFIIIHKQALPSGTHFQMLFSTKNETGGLAKAINTIAQCGFNMESLKSKADPNDAWCYYFHVEIEGNLNSEAAKDMLTQLHTHCMDIKLLGCYEKKEGTYETVY